MLIFLIFLTTLGQCINNNLDDFFEGKISYKVSITDETGNSINSKEIGDELYYYIKDGKYINKTNGTPEFKEIYDGRDTIYSYLDSKLVEKRSIKNNLEGEVIELHREANVDTILGYGCDKLTITNSKFSFEYYYNRSLRLDHNAFKNHHDNHLNVPYKETKSLPLKVIVYQSDLTLEYIAYKVERKELDNEIFVIPDF